jgi:mannan endo-1,4-beta-mannosidase
VYDKMRFHTIVWIASTACSVAMAQFVTMKNATFYLGNKVFVPVGFNAYWMGIDEDYNYPSAKRLEEMFKVAKAMAATAIRSHTLGHSSGNVKSLLMPNGQINAQAWTPIDQALVLARKYNIRLVVPFTDNYWYYNGNYGDYAVRRGLPKTAFWTNPQLIADFKSYIRAWLTHVNPYTKLAYKDDPYFAMLETGNELGNIRNSDNSVPPKAWIVDITSFIRSIDKNHLILDGSDESLGQSDNFNIATVNVYSRHFYGEDYDAMHSAASDAAAVGKPLIIGEYDSHFPDSWMQTMEREQNVKGTFFWSMYGHDDEGNWIRHDDGYTQYYGDPSSTRDLVKLSNHMRRMQHLPQVRGLPALK